MAYGYPYQQIPNYFNTNYSINPTIATVPDEQTARNAQFPMDGSAAYLPMRTDRRFTLNSYPWQTVQ